MDLHHLPILFFVAFCGTLWIFKTLLNIALLKGIVDNPDARKLQKRPIPVLGGPAVFFGILISSTASGLFVDTAYMYAILGAMSIMLYVGIMDDILLLPLKTRFVIEIIVVLLLIYCNNCPINDFHGLWGIHQIPDWAAVPLTIFACVGILNAINLIDGVNGLSSGYCISALSLLGSAFLWANHLEAATFAILTIGALTPFFLHNVFGQKSRMFIGDGGSLMMGTLLSAFLMTILNGDSPVAAKADGNFGLVPFTLAVFSIPVFDTLRVMTSRIKNKKSPFSPDKTHLHHLLLETGFSHLGVTIFETFSNLIVVLAWWTAYRAGASIDMQLYIVVAFGIMFTFGFYNFKKWNKRKGTGFYSFMQRVGEYSHIEHLKYIQKLSNILDKGCMEMEQENTNDK